MKVRIEVIVEQVDGKTIPQSARTEVLARLEEVIDNHEFTSRGHDKVYCALRLVGISAYKEDPSV